MTSRAGLPIRLVVSDSGPLISLAACGRLDLLLEFRRPVHIPDVVKAECLRFPEKVGAATLAQWFEPDTCPAYIMPTPLLVAWQQAVADEALNPNLHMSVGLGDAAIAWLLRQIQSYPQEQEPTLVLTEDGPFGDGVIRNDFPEVHVLSTRALLRTLENFGRIPSAQAILDDIAHAGRQLARYLADRPGRPSPGTKTSWAEVLAYRRPDPGDIS